MLQTDADGEGTIRWGAEAGQAGKHAEQEHVHDRPLLFVTAASKPLSYELATLVEKLQAALGLPEMDKYADSQT